MIAIIEIRYRNYTHHTLYRSRLPIYGIAIVRSSSFVLLDDFEGNANISVAIKSGSTVVAMRLVQCSDTAVLFQNMKVILLEDLASHFNIKTQVCSFLASHAH